jgi:pyrimidine-specific ribonucleoside hydrolase
MFKKIAFLLLILTLLPVSTLPAAAQDAMAQPVIIDTDMALDDWMAILYILNDPAFDVKAITVTGTGLAYCDAGVDIALGLVALAEHEAVPVSCWREEPLASDNAFPAEWRIDMATAESLGLPEGGSPAEQDALALFSETVAASEEPIQVLALGPLTTVGAALEADPSLVDQIAMITIMGGAVDVAGSGITEENTSAEWNIYCDPHGARLTIESGAPITLVALDATDQAPVTPEFLTTLEAAQDSPEAAFVYENLLGNMESIENGWYFFWDPLAAAVMADAELVTLEPREITVIETPGADDGRTKPVGNGSEILLAVAPDTAAFEQAFIAGINQ